MKGIVIYKSKYGATKRYAKWIAEHPDKKVWNKALHAYIHIKFLSINETSGQASVSYESTS